MALLRWLVPLIVVFLSTGAFAGGRVALIIGNANYEHVTRLSNPSNDAVSIAVMLKQADFDHVDIATNLRLSEFLRKLSDFELLAEKADVALIYYSGHGLEQGGDNYLVPVDAVLARDTEVSNEAVPLDRVLKAVSGAHRLKLVILDACRNNPFVASMQRTSATRSIGDHGLARIEPVMPDTLVAYAAKAGTLASDGNGTNSPFTTALLNHLTEPNLDIRFALGRVRDEVVKQTKGTSNPQEPFVYGSLGGAEIPLFVKAAATTTDDSTGDAAWDMVRDTTSTASLFRFIDRYPMNSHRADALKRAADLETLNNGSKGEPVRVEPRPAETRAAPTKVSVAAPAASEPAVTPPPVTPEPKANDSAQSSEPAATAPEKQRRRRPVEAVKPEPRVRPIVRQAPPPEVVDRRPSRRLLLLRREEREGPSKQALARRSPTQTYSGDNSAESTPASASRAGLGEQKSNELH